MNNLYFLIPVLALVVWFIINELQIRNVNKRQLEAYTREKIRLEKSLEFERQQVKSLEKILHQHQQQRGDA